MKSSARNHTKNALVNLLAFPGLGSVRSGRYRSGFAQIALVMAGTVLILVWLYRVLNQYYGLMFGDAKVESIGWIGILGGVVFLAAWLWSLVTSIGMLQEASRLARPPVISTPMDKATANRISNALATLPQWQQTGEVIACTYEFADFVVAMQFVNAVADLAESVQHHPDIDVRWNRVTLALTTHDAGGLTEKDFALARECDAAARKLPGAGAAGA